MTRYDPTKDPYDLDNMVEDQRREDKFILACIVGFLVVSCAVIYLIFGAVDHG